MKNRIISLMLLSIIIFTVLFSTVTYGTEYERPDVYKGKVVEVEDDTISEEGYGYQEVKVKILNGKYDGIVISINHYIDETMAYNVRLSKGDSIYCMVETDNEGNITQGHLYEFRRDKYIYILLIIFLIMIVAIGGIKGIKSLITLILTLVGVYFMLKGVVSGGNPIFLSIIVCIIVTILTITIISGFNIKSVCAIFGTMFGVIIAGILALIISYFSNLSGLGSTEAQMLVHNTSFNFKGILFASILLGTLGAVMDVCMSIASSINEIRIANPELKPIDLFKSGMNIGRDVMGTMSNTLILAYVGTSMFLLLVFLVNDVPYFDIINMDLIATEVVRALSGTIGIIASLPITAFISANLEKKYEKTLNK